MSRTGLPFVELPLDEALEAIETMTNRKTAVKDGVHLELGSHPHHGRVMFILSPIGTMLMFHVASLFD